MSNNPVFAVRMLPFPREEDGSVSLKLRPHLLWAAKPEGWYELRKGLGFALLSRVVFVEGQLDYVVQVLDMENDEELTLLRRNFPTLGEALQYITYLS